MRPNIEEIRERVGTVTVGPWSFDPKDNMCLGNEFVRVIWAKLYEGDEEPTLQAQKFDADFIAHSRTDIPALLAYIDELENMPLVQTVVKLQEENERLVTAIGHYARNEFANDWSRIDYANQILISGGYIK